MFWPSSLSRLSRRHLLYLSWEGVETFDVEKGKWTHHDDILESYDLTSWHRAIEVPIGDEMVVVRIGGFRNEQGHSSKRVTFHFVE